MAYILSIFAEGVSRGMLELFPLLNFPVITWVGKASRGVASFFKSESRMATDDTDFTDFSVSSSHPLNP